MGSRFAGIVRILTAASAAVLFLSACAGTEESGRSLSGISSAAETAPTEENTESESEASSCTETEENTESESANFDEETVEIPFDRESMEEVGKDEAEEISGYLRDTLGTNAKETGYEYIYAVRGKIEFEQKPFYLIDVRWLVEDGEGNVTNSSRVTELVLSEDRSEIYEAWIGLKDNLFIYKKEIHGYSDPTEESTESDEEKTVEIPFDRESMEEVGEDEAEEISCYLKDTLGTNDKETGLEYIYGVMGKIEFEQKPFYLIAVRWFVENEEGKITHTSRVGELVLSEDRSEIYSAWLDMNNSLCIHKGKLYRYSE